MKNSSNTSRKKKPLTFLSNYFYSGIILTSLLCSLNLQAQPLAQRGPIPFYIYDINSNGSISQDEFHTIRGQRMEYKASQGYPMNNMAFEPKFNQFDTDNDGQLSPEEFTSGMQQHMQKRRNIGSGQGMGMGQSQGRGMNRGRNMPNFEDFDANKDGMISEQELIEARSMRISSRIQQGYQMRNTANIPLFKDIDTNSDGQISPEEFSAQQKLHQMERKNAPFK